MYLFEPMELPAFFLFEPMELHRRRPPPRLARKLPAAIGCFHDLQARELPAARPPSDASTARWKASTPGRPTAVGRLHGQVGRANSLPTSSASSSRTRASRCRGNCLGKILHQLSIQFCEYIILFFLTQWIFLLLYWIHV
jgi:hypothetical protein